MSSPFEDFRPFNHRFDPNAYRLSDFTQALNDPDISAATTINEAFMALQAIGDLGHIALIRGGLTAYAEWRDYATNYATQLTTNEVMDFSHAPRMLVGLLYQGTVNGDETAGQHLRQILGHSETPAGSGIRIRQLLNTCLTEGVFPGVWIDQYAANNNERAWMWGEFIDPGDDLIRITQAVPKEEIRIGIASTTQAFLEGEMSPERTVEWAGIALGYAQTSEEKQRIVARIEAFIPDARTNTTEKLLWTDTLELVAKINADPDITLASKTTLDQQIMAYLPAWDSRDKALGRASFELSCLIRDGATPEAVQMRIKGILEEISEVEIRMAAEGEPYDNSVEDPIFGSPIMTDSEELRCDAAEHFIDQGQFEQAATLIAGVDSFTSWQDMLEYYVNKGGDLAFIRAAEYSNELLEAIKLGAGIDPNDDTACRMAELDYLESTQLTQPDHESAFGALLIQYNTSKNVSFALAARLDKLLQSTPALVDRYSDFTGLRQDQDQDLLYSMIRRIFVAHGNSEAKVDAWQKLQAGTYSAPHYLKRFADLALTSTGVMTRYA